MKTIAEQILSGLNKFYAAFQTKRVLKTMEEVEANTSEANLVAAPVVAELNDKLANGRVELVVTNDGLGYKLDGADTVLPFSRIGSKIVLGNLKVPSVGSSVSVRLEKRPRFVIVFCNVDGSWHGNVLQIYDGTNLKHYRYASKMGGTLVNMFNSTDISVSDTGFIYTHRHFATGETLMVGSTAYYYAII